MRLQIRLVDQIDAVTVAQPVPQTLIGIMGGPYRIDIVFFQNADILLHFIRRNRTSSVAGKLMPVDAAEYDPFPIQAHDAVLHFKPAEADILPDHFLQGTDTACPAVKDPDRIA